MRLLGFGSKGLALNSDRILVEVIRMGDDCVGKVPVILGR